MTRESGFSAPLLATDPVAARRRPAVDWPTMAVHVGTYGAFGLLTWFHRTLPWWLLLVAGGYVVCLHGSLQHEAVHGQPFRSRWLNSLMVFPSLWLWLPYTHYRETHLKHHRNERLTSPTDDPESNYVTPDQLVRMGAPHRWLRQAMRTLAGRMLLGPAYFTGQVMVELAGSIMGRDQRQLRHWLIHIPAVGVTLLWVIGVCGMPLWTYVLLFAYPGVSLTVMRSFLEHQAVREVDRRTAIVEAGPILGLMFMHNNLHALHHAEPATPWHARPARYRAQRQALLAANGGYLIPSYGAVARRYLLRPKEPLLHPLGNV